MLFRSGKRVGLANKEVLVAAGDLVTRAQKSSGAELLPVDSEHNAAHQCFRAGRRDEVAKLILTASGGPFRETHISALQSVTPEQALNHPTWKMGPRITIDSATLMNKGFEVIEACWLFDLSPKEVQVVVHPQSKVHAMVEYNDGSVIAQVSATDMRMPIQYALTYPERADAPVPRLDWTQAAKWTFDPPDFRKFPLLGKAYEVYLSRVIPMVGNLVTRQGSAYRYLSDSVLAFRTPQELRDVMVRAGLRNVTYRTVNFGTIAMHVGEA